VSDFFLVFIACLILFSVFRRYIFFFVMRAISKKVFGSMNMQQQQTDRKPDGTVTVDTSNAKPRVNNDDGEYVSYEEIK
jgi:hypothetical protein